MNSSRSTNFMSPKAGAESLFREAVLDLSSEAPFARLMVNSGRLSLPCTLDGAALNGPDTEDLPAMSRPGAAMPDAPLQDGWLLEHTGGRFVLLALNCRAGDIQGADLIELEASGALADRYLGSMTQAIYLIRPDQHIAARWAGYDAEAVSAALARAKGH